MVVWGFEFGEELTITLSKLDGQSRTLGCPFSHVVQRPEGGGISNYSHYIAVACNSVPAFYNTFSTNPLISNHNTFNSAKENGSVLRTFKMQVRNPLKEQIQVTHFETEV